MEAISIIEGSVTNVMNRCKHRVSISTAARLARLSFAKATRMEGGISDELEEVAFMSALAGCIFHYM